MSLALATLCHVTAAPTTTASTTIKFEARLRPFGSGLKRVSNTANQSSLSGAWGNISAPWPTPRFPAPAETAPNPSLNPTVTLTFTPDSTPTPNPNPNPNPNSNSNPNLYPNP